MKIIRVITFSLLGGCCCLILVGCAVSPAQMYTGPPRPPDEVAIVNVDRDLWRFSVDDCNRPARLVELLPGPHTYVVALCRREPWGPHTWWPYDRHRYWEYGWNRYWTSGWDNYLYTEPVTLEFDATADHQYRVGFKLWVVHEDDSRGPYLETGFIPLPRSDRLDCEFQVFDSTSKEKVAQASAAVKISSSIYCPHAANPVSKLCYWQIN